MKIIFTVLLSLFTFLIGYSQTASYKTHLNKGKKAFNSAEQLFGNDNAKQAIITYHQAVASFKQALKLNPSGTEAHYFLGYTYSRLNHTDGQSLVTMTLPMALITSHEFERVNKLTLKYKGQQLALDPYSKIGSEWASLALKYIYQNKADSAVWALKEGNKRGGFSDLNLSVCREMLSACHKNAILISSGDVFTFTFLYLQKVEQLRQDVIVADVSLLNTDWYPNLLMNSERLAISLPKAQLDTINYIAWKDTILSINIRNSNKSFLWKLKPSYAGEYLLRGDRILLNILQTNEFERDIYFTPRICRV